jgi:hypothetical protein
VTDESHTPVPEKSEAEADADDACPTLAELKARQEELNARITDHFNLLRGR